MFGTEAVLQIIKDTTPREVWKHASLFFPLNGIYVQTEATPFSHTGFVQGKGGIIYNTAQAYTFIS